MTATLQLLGETRYAFANPYQDVRGWPVRDSDGRELGHLKDVLIDENAQKVRFLKVAHGGILGFGSSHSFIPTEAVVAVGDGQVVVETSMDDVADAPRFDPDVVDNERHLADIYAHYGYPPPWTPAAEVREVSDTSPT